MQPAIHLFSNANSEAAKAYAAQLAKETGKQIQTIDLSALTSGDLAGAEKNLDRVVKEAEQKGSILFFDEADSLFGKRTDIKDSHDKYANAEISWLLTRISQYKGMIVLASDQASTIDSKLLHPPNTASRHH
jgi:SpoVK/Ycf46/Vps4 family AAA+-type ATPase